MHDSHYDAGVPHYAAFDVVVIAASAGGIAALIPLLRNLPQSFPIPIIVVQHLPSASRHVSRLDQVLRLNTALQVKWAEDGEFPLPGTVYLAPQDRNTILSSKTGAFVVSGAASFSKPAADPLFCSAVERFGSRVMAVVLSGMLSDGAEGAAAIARAGGRVLAQTSSEAEFDDMPNAAMKRSRVGLPFDSVSLARIVANLVMIPGVAAWFGIGKAGVGADSASWAA